jgi:hypothetical protein
MGEIVLGDKFRFVSKAKMIMNNSHPAVSILLHRSAGGVVLSFSGSHLLQLFELAETDF